MTYRLNNGHSFKDGRKGGGHKGYWHGVSGTGWDWWHSAIQKRFVKRCTAKRNRRQCGQMIRAELFEYANARSYDLAMDKAKIIADWNYEVQFGYDPYDNFSWTVFEDEIPPGMSREYEEYFEDDIEEALDHLFRW